MKMSHTPAPWLIRDDGAFGDKQLVIHTDDGIRVAVLPYRTQKDLDEAMVDARLISAAPAMLEALEAIVAAVKRMNGGALANVRTLAEDALFRARLGPQK